MIVNVIVTQHHRRPSTQTGLLEMVLGRFGCFFFFCGYRRFWLVLGRFVWFCLVPCFSNYASPSRLIFSLLVLSSFLFVGLPSLFRLYKNCYSFCCRLPDLIFSVGFFFSLLLLYLWGPLLSLASFAILARFVIFVSA